MAALHVRLYVEECALLFHISQLRGVLRHAGVSGSSGFAPSSLSGSLEGEACEKRSEGYDCSPQFCEQCQSHVALFS